ncbi:MAG: NAD(P)H-dependent glycerol-3-phosphate dehydrogenase [Proteobacteria bacterium]|nr:NAD(P)H-dependent glycerol-3-phosphate dehydrogenase [Pseudomonadota bacterium]
MNILILGSGAWGTSLAQVFAKNKNKVTLWSYEKEVSLQINKIHMNKKYLNNIKLSKNILSTNLPLNPKDFDFIFYVSPAQHLVSVLKQSLSSNKIGNIVICSKGIDIKRGTVISDVLIKHFKQNNIHVLSGPSFAREVALGKPAALSLGSKVKSNKLEKIFKGTNIRIYLSKEYKAIQLLGAIKNSYAIGSGIIEGLSLGENARAAYLTRVIQELRFLLKTFKYKDTFVESLAGIGDLILTCSSMQSRNFKLGFTLGKGGKAINYIKKNININEGYFTAMAVTKNKKINLNKLPILNSLIKVIKGSSAENEMKKLLARPFKKELF